jgi:fused signal recognition particle receptor
MTPRYTIRFQKYSMFGFGKSKERAVAPAAKEDPAPSRGGLLSRLRAGLDRTRHALSDGLSTLLKGKREIDEELLEEIETRLLVADLGVEATKTIIDNLRNRVARRQLSDAEALFDALHHEMVALLQPVSQPLVIGEARPWVILVVGINGAGKTTTIGKLAKQLQQQGHSVLLAAGDTFRAAAVEQLQIWGERNAIPVIAQGSGADSASVIHDAIAAARSRGIEIVIADTAGRLHTQSNLMAELKKIHRVIGRFDASAPHEVLLVLDAGIGQNAISQARQFHAAVNVSGIAMTKLDGTAKGGVIFAVASQLALPIRLIGVGEKIDDLRPFIADDFVAALLDRGPA